MAENVTNELLYETLKAVRADIADNRRLIIEVRDRVATVERDVADSLVQVAQVKVQMADMNRRVDGIEDRLARIERNLDLVRG